MTAWSNPERETVAPMETTNKKASWDEEFLNETGRLPRYRPAQYEDWECLEEKNSYGGRIVDAGHFEGIHYPANVPRSGGSPPVCSCGWTRHRGHGDVFFELSEHIADQGEFGTLDVPSR